VRVASGGENVVVVHVTGISLRDLMTVNPRSLRHFPTVSDLKTATAIVGLYVWVMVYRLL